MKFKSFASDNNAGTHPEILKAVNECNEGHVIGYGDDPYTEEAVHNFKDRFGQDTDVYFVYGGTGANVLGLKTIADSYHSILCAETAHIYVDECSAPELFTGCKLQPIPTADGKLTPEQIEPYLHGFGFPHHAQPKVISITQPTEMGTVYSVPEIRELRRLADTYGLFLHMDGARISNAAARLNKTFKEFTVDAGVDVLSFGGTKNGMMFGEAVLFFNNSLPEAFKYIRKQGMQLHSKMRFISAQFIAFFRDDLWLRNARHANLMARVLLDEVKQMPRIKITQKVEINGIFAVIPPEIIQPLQKEYFFYVWNEETSEVRWMTAWDTERTDIENFTKALRKYLSK